jgi:hypothetical protein
MLEVYCLHDPWGRSIQVECLLGAPGSFQQLKEIVIHNISNILAYIDNLLVHTKNHGKQCEILDELFTRLKQHRLKMNLSKSFFSSTEGFRLMPDGIKPGADKLKPMAAEPCPTMSQKSEPFEIEQLLPWTCQKLAQLAAQLSHLTTNTLQVERGPSAHRPQQSFQGAQVCTDLRASHVLP